MGMGWDEGDGDRERDKNSDSQALFLLAQAMFTAFHIQYSWSRSLIGRERE